MKTKVAVIQCNGERFPFEKQVAYLTRLIEEAAKHKASFIAVPEAALGYWQKGINEVSPTHPVFKHFSELAKTHGIWLLPGTLWERPANQSKPFNTAFLINPKGKVISNYRKRFLFDVSLPSGQSIRESSKSKRGTQTVTCRIPFGKVGLGICFDLRYPGHFLELNRKSRIDLILLPSNFTYETGKDHWLPLLKARAIEHQCYLLAPNQCGIQKNGKASFGTSVIIDPWGKVLAKAPVKSQKILYATLDNKKIAQIRRHFPLKYKEQYS